MHLLSFFRGGKGIFSILLLTILIISSILAIIYLDNLTTKAPQDNQLQDTLVLKRKITAILSEDLNDPTRADSSRLLQKFAILENLKSSEKEKYESLVIITNFTQSIYSDTHNPELYDLINNDIADYAKKYYPDLYDEAYFLYSCQDPTCAENKQPEEILAVIDLINASDFPKEVKETLPEDLLNTGYRSNSEIPGKVRQYLIIAEMIRRNDNFSQTGQNVIIADKIENFVKSKYPNEYKAINENN